MTALFLSCTTSGSSNFTVFDTAPLFAMVYDSTGAPVAGAEIILDGEKPVRTDITGRVLLENVSRGKHSIVIHKKDFQDFAANFTFSNREQVFYAALRSIESILKSLEEDLITGSLSRAAEHIKEARMIDADDLRLRYLNIVFLTRKKKYAGALQEVKDLERIYPDDPALEKTEKEIASCISRSKKNTTPGESEGEKK